MKQVIWATMALLIPLSAFADSSQIIAQCDAMHPGTDFQASLQKEFCRVNENQQILLKRLRQLEAHREQSDKLSGTAASPGSTGATKVNLDQTLVQVQQLLAKLQNPAQTAEPSSAKDGAASAKSAPPSPAVRIVSSPGQYAATTYEVDGPLLWVSGLPGGVDQHLRLSVNNGVDIRIVVRKNGVPVPVAHAGSILFEEFYADINNDGRPDPLPYRGVDPQAVSDLFISHVSPRDRIEILYLLPTGKLLLVPNFPPQILWGLEARVKLDRVSVFGRRRINARNGRKI